MNYEQYALLFNEYFQDALTAVSSLQTYLQLGVLLFRWIGLPILALHLVGLLPDLIIMLEEISLNVGNVSISAYGVLRVFVFGGFLFWLGRY
jgi:hypothetical protein